jgi:hypothetical protein
MEELKVEKNMTIGHNRFKFATPPPPFYEMSTRNTTNQKLTGCR